MAGLINLAEFFKTRQISDAIIFPPYSHGTPFYEISPHWDQSSDNANVENHAG